MELQCCRGNYFSIWFSDSFNEVVRVKRKHSNTSIKHSWGFNCGLNTIVNKTALNKRNDVRRTHPFSASRSRKYQKTY